MRVNDFPLKNKFLIVSIFAFIIIGYLIFAITENRVQTFLLEHEKNDFQKDVQDKAQASFNLDLPLSLRNNAKLSEFADTLKDETQATSIKVYNPNGNMVYSDVATEIGQNYSDEPGIKDAATSNINTSGINLKTLGMTEYVPIKSANGEVRGIVSARIKLAQEISFVKNFALQLDALLGIIAIGFATVIYYIFSSAEADMTERDHSLLDQSKAFEEEKQLDDAIMATMAESLTVINKDGQIMLFNPETERLTGHKSSGVEYRLYRKFLVFFDKDGKEITNNPITGALKSGKAVQVSIKDGYSLKNLNGQLIPVAVSIAPIFDKDQKTQGVVVTIQDISTEKELDAVKDEFVYVVAHELGNPIFALDGYLGLLEDKKKSFDKGTVDIIKTARSINSQLSELVNDLLEVTRNEQGTLQFELGPVDIASVSKTVVENAQFKARAKKITLNYENGKQLKVKANEQKVKEVITNFVDNAIKYTPEGGKIWVSHKVEGGGLTTIVRDNGLGISKEDQEKLFTKFYRVKNKNTNGISGTGLGLFICRQIVEKCGGRVLAESEENKGSTFSFTLKITNK